MLGIVAANPTTPGPALADLVLNKSGDDMRFLGRAILLMWYFGAWYQPSDLGEERQHQVHRRAPSSSTC